MANLKVEMTFELSAPNRSAPCITHETAIRRNASNAIRIPPDFALAFIVEVNHHILWVSRSRTLSVYTSSQRRDTRIRCGSKFGLLFELAISSAGHWNRQWELLMYSVQNAKCTVPEWSGFLQRTQNLLNLLTPVYLSLELLFKLGTSWIEEVTIYLWISAVACCISNFECFLHPLRNTRRIPSLPPFCYWRCSSEHGESRLGHSDWKR
jgi:hypothetical protein